MNQGISGSLDVKNLICVVFDCPLCMYTKNTSSVITIKSNLALGLECNESFSYCTLCISAIINLNHPPDLYNNVNFSEGFKKIYQQIRKLFSKKPFSFLLKNLKDAKKKWLLSPHPINPILLVMEI